MRVSKYLKIIQNHEFPYVTWPAVDESWASSSWSPHFYRGLTQLRKKPPLYEALLLWRQQMKLDIPHYTISFQRYKYECPWLFRHEPALLKALRNLHWQKPEAINGSQTARCINHKFRTSTDRFTVCLAGVCFFQHTKVRTLWFLPTDWLERSDSHGLRKSQGCWEFYDQTTSNRNRKM